MIPSDVLWVSRVPSAAALGCVGRGPRRAPSLASETRRVRVHVGYLLLPRFLAPGAPIGLSAGIVLHSP